MMQFWLHLGEEYDLDVKSDQTTGDVHHAMSAGQIVKAVFLLRIIGASSSCSAYLSQIVHDLAFILFADILLFSLLATKFFFQFF